VAVRCVCFGLTTCGSGVRGSGAGVGAGGVEVDTWVDDVWCVRGGGAGVGQVGAKRGRARACTHNSSSNSRSSSSSRVVEVDE